MWQLDNRANKFWNFNFDLKFFSIIFHNKRLSNFYIQNSIFKILSPEVGPLTALHTVWVRYHNYLVEALSNINGHWSGEQLYNEARKIVSSMHQKITFYDYLPGIVGPTGAAALGQRLK